jgi:hypothetical protein
MTMTNNRFTMCFPDGWKEATIHTFEGPMADGVKHNLLLSIEPLGKKERLEDFARTRIGMCTAALPAFRLLNEAEMVLPDGTVTRVVMYRFSPAANKTMYQKQYFMIVGGKGCIFTASFSKKTLRTIAVDVDAIVASFVNEPSRPE